MHYCLYWDEWYWLAYEFFLEYGHLKVPYDFKTIDGYALGNWIVTQRMNYRNGTLSSERIKLLDDICMIWDIKKDKFDVVLLCDEYNIDIQKNKSILKNMPSIELKIKLLYLSKKMIDIFDENGFLHRIFSMSNIDMKVQYGHSLRELIQEYKKGKSK